MSREAEQLMVDGEYAPLDRAQWSWILFDVGSWAYCTVTMYTYMPVYFKSSDTREGHHMAAYWAAAMSAAMLGAALIGPVVGGLADRFSKRKTILALFTLACCVAGCLFPVALRSGLEEGLVNTVCMFLSYSVASMLYNALLASLFTSTQRHYASATATAWSNGGSAVLLGGIYLLQQFLGVNDMSSPEATKFVQFTALGAAGWWIALWVPLCLFCPEPEVAVPAERLREASCWETHVREPVRQLWHLKDLWRFVAANIFMNEASGVCYHTSLIYAMTIGVVDAKTAVLTTIYNRAISVFFSFFWAEMVKGGRVSAKTCYLVIELLLLCSAVLCACLASEWEYWVLCTMLACTGTGSFAFSRSVMASLAPPHMVAQVFGLSGSLSRMSGFIGPLVYAAATHLTGNARLGYIPVALFLIVALAITCTVDLERGVHQALETAPASAQAERHEDEGSPKEQEHHPLLVQEIDQGYVKKV